MNDLFANGLEIYLLRASLLLAAFWTGFACLGSHPRARVLLCRVVLVGLVLLPLAGLVPAPPVASVPALPVMGEPVDEAFHVVPAAQPPPGPRKFVMSSVSSARLSPPSAMSTPTRPWTLAGLAVAVWLTGATVLVARWVVGLWLARRLARSATSPPEWIDEARTTFCKELGLRRTVRVGVVEEMCSPLLIGPRPLILLPRQLVDFQAKDDVLAALAHELGHVRERDWPWSQALHVGAALLWPMPLLWFLRRAHDSASELVCDQVAANLRGGAESYAGSLARQSLLALGHDRLATVPMLRRSGIRRRVDALLSGAGLPPMTRGLATLLVLSALLTAVLLAGVQLARAENKPSPPALAAKLPPAGTDAWVRYNYSPAAIRSIYAQLYGYFQKIDSLSYTGTEVTHLGSSYDGQQLVQTTTFVGSGDRYDIEQTRQNLTASGAPLKDPAPDQAPTADRHAFNGTGFQTLDAGKLFVQKGPPFWPVLPSLSFLELRDYFTLPFDFVNRTLTEDPNQPVNLTPYLFRRLESWNLKSRRFQNGTLLGKQGLVLDVLGKDDEGDDTTISVLLDPAHDFYPVAWTMPDARHLGLAFNYVIDELGTAQGGGQSIYYPKTATISMVEEGKAMWSRNITVDPVTLNDIAVNDPRFTIDPKLATSVSTSDDATKDSKWSDVVARQDALIAARKERIDSLHLPDGMNTALIVESSVNDNVEEDLIAHAITVCPQASLVYSWNSDGRYLPEHPGERTPLLKLQPDDPKIPWPNWQSLPRDKAPAFWVNPPAKNPTAYANDIYVGIYWAIQRGCSSVVVLSTFRAGDRPEATQAVISAMRAAHVRLYLASNGGVPPYPGLADYARESGGAVVARAGAAETIPAALRSG